MTLVEEHNSKYAFFREITGEAMRVHRKYRGGLLESAYEAALKYLLEQKGFAVERQVFVPMYWDNVRLDQDYRLDLLVNGNVIIELKSVKHIDTPHRQQLWSYLRITRIAYGMLINFSPDGLYSEWYHYHDENGEIDKIKLL